MMIVQYDPASGEVTGQVIGDADPSTFDGSVIVVPEGTDLSHKAVDPSTESLVWSVSLSEAQQIRVEDVKKQAREALSQTDWYVVRKQETGEEIPQDVLDHRSTVRSKSDTFEREINGLDAVESVLTYQFAFPDPPENA